MDANEIEMDANSKKMVLVSLLRAIGQLKQIMDESDRGFLKDLALSATQMDPQILSIGIRLAILDHDTQTEAENDEQLLGKRRELLTLLIAIVKPEILEAMSGVGASSGDADREDEHDYEDDFEDDFEDDDMLMPDGDHKQNYDADDGDDEDESDNDDVDDDGKQDHIEQVKNLTANGFDDDDDDQSTDDDAEDDADADADEAESSMLDASADPRLLELARSVCAQKKLLQQKMDFVKEQLSMLSALKESCESRLSEVQRGDNDDHDYDVEELPAEA